MRFVCPAVVLLVIASAASLRAQSSVPTLNQPIPAQAMVPGGQPVTIDVRNHFTVPGVVGTQFAQFDTVFGRFNVELRDDAAPRHVANFLTYVRANAYTNTFIHRAASFDGGAVSVVQGGGWSYRLPFEVFEIPKLAPIPLEYNLANAVGTLAAARLGNPNTATSEWYFNVRDNSTILNQTNNSGYTVFGRVMGTGMTIINQMAGFQRHNFNGAFSELPLRNYTSGNPNEAHLLVINTIREVTLFPTGSGDAALTITADNSAPTVLTSTISGSTLTLTPLTVGTANLTVRVTDPNGNAATGTFAVTVAVGAPVFTAQPMSQSVNTGSTVVFNAPATGAASYRWERNGQVVSGATSSILVINNATSANAGSYIAFATNATGTVQSSPATLTILNLPATDVGRLINLSVLAASAPGAKVLTMGATIGHGSANSALPLVIRGVGPTLAQPPFNVPGVLADPVMSLFTSGNNSPIESNDDWGGGAALASAFQAVGAFALPTTSLDSSIARTAPGLTPGGYTVQIAGKGGASGNAIAEAYDASGSTRTATTPRLTNLSTLSDVPAGTELAVGFVLGGLSSRTVLVRSVGPSLVQFNIAGLMADPRLELFNNAGQRIATNDDWAGSAEIATVSTAVGAFSLTGASSKDAVLLVTLPPGTYSARIAGAGGSGGTAIVEVYEVP